VTVGILSERVCSCILSDLEERKYLSERRGVCVKYIRKGSRRWGVRRRLSKDVDY
jgi:hypothetical protein